MRQTLEAGHSQREQPTVKLAESEAPVAADDDLAENADPVASNDADAVIALPDDDQEDPLSAGLRRSALLSQRARMLAAARRQAQVIARKVRIEREQAEKLRKWRLLASSARERGTSRKQSRAEKRSSEAAKEINTVLKKVVEEMETEKFRCQTYLATAQKEAAAAHETSMDDQEVLARIDTTLHSSKADLADIEHQLSQLSDALKAHETRCASNMAELRAEMDALVKDANTTATLMGASPCKGKSLLLQCQRLGARRSYFTSRHRGLRQVMAQLSTRTARRSLQHALRHVVQSSEVAKQSDESTALLQKASRHRRLRHGRREQRQEQQYSKHRSAQCSIAATDCKVVESAIVWMMADVQDQQSTTNLLLEKTRAECDKETTDLDRESAHFMRRQEMLNLQVTQALAQKSGIQGDVAARLEDYHRLQQGLGKIRQECESSVKAYENQECTLKSTRTEMVNKAGSVKPEELQDCEVSPWSPAEGCSEECGGGTQEWIRTVVVPSGAKGMPCPTLRTSRACNVQACPVDCEVSQWTGWSECSAMCGGGIRTRYRQVTKMAQHGGEMCPGRNDHSDTCNPQPCQADCTLGSWSPWSSCSRACNGGFHKRYRLVTKPAEGNGMCWTEDQRTDYRRCTSQACPTVAPGESFKCNAAVDLTVVLDASSGVSSADFAEEKKFVRDLMKAMGLGKSRVALVLAGGPKTWKHYEKCKNEGSSVDALKSCNVAVKLSFSAVEGDVLQAVDQSDPLGGPAYTAGALSLASNQVDGSQPGADAVVLVLAHGRPLSESRTEDEAKRIRKKARLMWLVVGGDTAKSPIKSSRVLSRQLASSWASRPISDNFFEAPSFKELQSSKRISELVSAMCPALA
jgi:hypothetical protein